MSKFKVFFGLLLLGCVFSFQNLRAEVKRGEAYQVGNVKLNCIAATGLKITSQTDSTVTSSHAGFTKDFAFDLNPGFFNWTWITLTSKNQIAADGYQIFLLGNAIEGKETTLFGVLGHILSSPVPGVGPGMVYPLGFIPQLAISCKIYWENTLRSK